jgi:hypothetical protein
MQGIREWQDYQVTARMTPHMCQAGGLAPTFRRVIFKNGELCVKLISIVSAKHLTRSRSGALPLELISVILH